MISYFEYMIAFRYLKSKRKDSFISIVSAFSLIGITLGVATLIIVMSVMNGFHNQFVKHILGIEGHLTLISNSRTFNNYNLLIDKIKKVKGVEFVAPMVFGQGMVVHNNMTSGVEVRGMDAQDTVNKPLIKDSLPKNTIEELKTSNNVIIGISLAKNLNIKIGDKIKLIAPETTNTIIGMVPRIKTFKVIGIFDVGFYRYNATTIFMSLSDAQVFFKDYNSITHIEIMVQNPEKLNRIKSDITSIAGDSTQIIDWEQAQEKWLNALEVERNVMFLILALIIVVAAFNIISGLIMLVKDKTKNIAILRTIGANKSSIIKIFVISGATIGIMGTFLGGMLGVWFATHIDQIKRFLEKLTGSQLFDPLIYFLTKLPSEVDVSSVTFIIIMSLLFSTLATIYPAWRAAKITPAEVLRYE